MNINNTETKIYNKTRRRIRNKTNKKKNNEEQLTKYFVQYSVCLLFFYVKSLIAINYIMFSRTEKFKFSFAKIKMSFLCSRINWKFLAHDDKIFIVVLWNKKYTSKEPANEKNIFNVISSRIFGVCYYYYFTNFN